MNFSVDDYLSLVEAQHKPRPKFMAVLRKYLELGQTAGDVSFELPEDFSLDAAKGKQLDVIGQIVGISRDYPYIAGSTTASMNDDQYRMVLRATIARNHWDGSFRSFAQTWNEVFSGLSMTATVVDNMDMSCTVTVSGDFDEDIASLITAGYVFPKPMGVKMDFAVSPQGDRTAYTDNYIGAALTCNALTLTITAL